MTENERWAKELAVIDWGICPVCDGTGRQAANPDSPCAACSGYGCNSMEPDGTVARDDELITFAPLPFATIPPMRCPTCGADCEARRVSHEVTHIDEFRTVHTVHDTRWICATHGDVTGEMTERYMAGFTRFFGY